MPTSYQQPGLYIFLLSPLARQILPGWRQHKPPPFPTMGYQVLRWPAALQRCHCKSIYKKMRQFHQPHLHHAKTVSRDSPLAKAEQGTPNVSWWQHCIPVSHIFVITGPPARILSHICVTNIIGSKFEALTSRPSSELLSERWDRQSFSLLKTLPCGTSEQDG